MTDSTIETPRARSMPNTSDLVGTGILALVGLVAVMMGLGYGFIGDNGQIGPGFMPVLTGAFILVASLADIGRLFLAPKDGSTAGLGGVAEELSAEAAAAQAAAKEERGASSEEELDTFGRTAKQRSRTVPLIFGIVLAAVLLIQVLGMLLSLTVMMFAVVFLVERKPLLPSLLTSAAVLAVAYLIFVVMLGVPLPQGMLGIL
ncbi:tripartite tricarboxylate transporter TctB family protein [Brachybacterium sp. sponge]|uniref:tripartite tricarboxylate transporter TctB family protein n=1 Tax=Brachybacterium sp. sponge TaxID=1775432 RepID=UPI0007A54174|nr:tripartite tricarboxylate transporter TctB family protein [Brachybacterium sp. sponge]